MSRMLQLYLRITSYSGVCGLFPTIGKQRNKDKLGFWWVGRFDTLVL